MKFRRKAKLFPGVYLNFSRSGISTTIGIPGANINIGKKGAYLNAGIPGTGLYDRQRIGGGKLEQSENENKIYVNESANEDIGAIKSNSAETTTTVGLHELRSTLLDCYSERSQLRSEIGLARGKLIFAILLKFISYLFVFGFFIKWFRENSSNAKSYLTDLVVQLDSCFVNIDMDLERDFEQKFIELQESFKMLSSSIKIWDVTSSIMVDQKATRSAASSVINRKSVKFAFGSIDIIKSKYQALHFENANGGDLFFYPAFVVIVDSRKKFGLIELSDFDAEFIEQHFIEEEKVPKDSKVISYTWAKVNKNGSPDKRFKDNRQIPVCRYGWVTLSSPTGLNEAYMFSNYESSHNFSVALRNYTRLVS